MPKGYSIQERRPGSYALYIRNASLAKQVKRRSANFYIATFDDEGAARRAGRKIINRLGLTTNGR